MNPWFHVLHEGPGPICGPAFLTSLFIRKHPDKHDANPNGGFAEADQKIS